MNINIVLFLRSEVDAKAPRASWRERHSLAHSAHAMPLLRHRWTSSHTPPTSFLRQGFVVALKVIFLWIPALAAWTAVLSGVTLDFRTAEEVKQEEQEAQRLERFFDVEHLPELEYVKEWADKEQALAQMVDKLIRFPPQDPFSSCNVLGTCSKIM